LLNALLLAARNDRFGRCASFFVMSASESSSASALTSVTLLSVQSGNGGREMKKPRRKAGAPSCADERTGPLQTPEEWTNHLIKQVPARRFVKI
jgi:hypothetical protein